MEWFANNLIESILIIGVVLLIIEIVVLGFSTFFLFFTGLAAIVTALIIWLGLIPETFLSTLISVSAFTLVFALALWKKLSALQNKTDTKRAKSDLIGHSFVLPADIVVALPLAEKPSYQYSGINWQLNALEDLNKGTMVEVIQADVGSLLVKAKVP
ncbi:MAG: NfeD family protein [Glaciecola sp.]|jgi:membrane protein implicated in regulation of membrane protease activity